MIKISNILEDLEKSMISKEIKTNSFNFNTRKNAVANVKEKSSNPFNIGLGTFYNYVEKDDCTGTDIIVNMATKIPPALEVRVLIITILTLLICLFTLQFTKHKKYRAIKL